MTLSITTPPRDAGAAGEGRGLSFGGRSAYLAFLLPGVSYYDAAYIFMQYNYYMI